ncbi:MAG: energy-coupling factor transporter transmembrane component T [Anaerolineae bacterium]|jgi:energy-coupling factor transport system permease protein
MAEFEFLRYVTIGQYLPLGSLIHRMDARFKLLAFGLLVVAVTFSNTYVANGVLLLTVMLLIVAARVPVGYTLQGIRPALPALILLAVFQLLLPPRPMGLAEDCNVIWRWSSGLGRPTTGVELTDCTLRLMIVSAVRLSALIVLTSLLTLSTTTTELAHGTEELLAPLQRVGLPAHELALVVAIALRFVPTLALQMERIVKAQIARGADFGTGSRLRIVKTIRRLTPLLIPLFLVSLRRSEALILAMEARGYTGGKGRTRRARLRARPADYVALAAAVLYCILMLRIDFSALDRALVTWLAGL